MSINQSHPADTVHPTTAPEAAAALSAFERRRAAYRQYFQHQVDEPFWATARAIDSTLVQVLTAWTFWAEAIAAGYDATVGCLGEDGARTVEFPDVNGRRLVIVPNAD